MNMHMEICDAEQGIQGGLWEVYIFQSADMNNNNIMWIKVWNHENIVYFHDFEHSHSMTSVIHFSFVWWGSSPCPMCNALKPSFLDCTTHHGTSSTDGLFMDIARTWNHGN